MERVIKILMKRDGLSFGEAKAAVDEFLEIANEYLEESADFDEIEQLLMDELGLEPDYLPELLGF